MGWALPLQLPRVCKVVLITNWISSLPSQSAAVPFPVQAGVLEEFPHVSTRQEMCLNAKVICLRTLNASLMCS